MKDIEQMVQVEWRGTTARVVDDGGQHYLVLERKVWRKDEVQTERYTVPSSDLPDLIELLPVVLKLYKER